MSRRLTGCPGAGRLPAKQGPIGKIETDAAGGKAICSRCGGLYGVRADGRIRAHRVNPSAIVPAIRGVRYTSGVIRAERA